MGTRSTQPKAQKGSQAPDRQAAEQIRRRLRAASGFRARPGSAGASIFRKWFKRGGESAPRISTSACSLPLCRIRESGSSCPAIVTQPSSEIGSNADCASSFALSCCRSFAPPTPATSRSARVTRRTLPNDTDSRPTSAAWSPASPRRAHRANSSNATRARPLRSRLPSRHFADPPFVVPVLSKLFRLRHRGDRAIRRAPRHLAGSAAHCSLPSISAGRVRPRSLAPRPFRTLHG